MDAIRVLKYQPNLIARGLRPNRTHTLGIVVPDSASPSFPKIVRGAEYAARERGYFLIVLDSQRSHATEIDMMTLLRQRVDPRMEITTSVVSPRAFFRRARLDVNYFDRRKDNFANDDQLLDTAVSFPIAFQKSNIYGAEGKLHLPYLGPALGLRELLLYGWLCVSSGDRRTFLGDDAADSLCDKRGRFWVSQAQRHTVRTRLRYQIVPRVWVAGGAEYGSGLPFEFEGIQEDATAQFGQAIADRVNFGGGRVKPNLSLDASVGADLWTTDRFTARLQADAEYLTSPAASPAPPSNLRAVTPSV